MAQDSSNEAAREAMMDRGRSLPGVAEALRVFEMASRRAPMPVLAVPSTRMSTGANSR